MNRRPTPIAKLYRWHADALAYFARKGTIRGFPQPILHNDPECCWYMTKLIKDGPWVPARIWLDQPVDETGELIADEKFMCEVDGKPRDPIEQWSMLAGRPISQEDYEYMMDTRSWQRTHAPEELTASVKRDLLKTPLPF